MRIAFVGASEVALMTAAQLIERGHEVIIIESNRQKIEEISEKIDCSFLHGDGSRPEVLKEVDPKSTDILFCLTDSDQANLISSLVGRSLGFKKVVTNIQDPQFENICRELGLEHVIVPNRMISHHLVDSVRGIDILELSTAIKGEARIFTFKIDNESAGSVESLELPKDSMVICYYREEKFFLPEEGAKFKSGDEVVVITHSQNLSELQKRFHSQKFKKNSEAKSKNGEKEKEKK